MVSYLKALGRYFDFSGRTRRREYWIFLLITTFLSGLTVGLYIIFVLIPTISIGVRRLHDTGRTGWWMLLGLIPIFGWIPGIIFMLQEGIKGPNRYGPDPKGRAHVKG